MAGHLKEKEKLKLLVEEKELFLFDVGNTLLHLDFSLLRSLLEKIGCHLEKEAWLEAEGRAREAVDQAVLEKRGVSDQQRGFIYFKEIFSRLGINGTHLSFLKEALQEADEQMRLWSFVLPETEEALLSFLKRGKRLGVVSNSDGRVRERLEKRNLASYFELILDSAKVGFEKPDPRIFEVALSFFGKEGEEALYIGDFYAIDVLGAKQAGVEGLLLKTNRFYSHPPCLEISSLREL